MQFLLLHAGAPDLGPAWNDEAWAALDAWLDETMGAGVSVAGNPLRLDADAITVKVRDGQVIVTDGPFAETKEQVAGFDLLECASVDEAVRWAAGHPHSWMGATEVRALTGDIPAKPLPEPKAGTTRYMLLICTDPAVGPEELARMKPVAPWVAEMNGREIRLLGSELEAPDSARTVRVRDKGTLVTDGPFAETKELIAGFDVLECTDLSEAIDVAARHPMAGVGVIDVRQFRALRED
jgi:hypothetical protein